MERRAGRAVVEGRRRARFIAERLGVALREERRNAGLTQRQVAAAAGLAQTRISALEHASGARTSIETWSILAASLGCQLAAFWERAPGATQPRDAEHLRRQELVIRAAATGGWTASAEEGLVVGPDRRRFVDVVLRREITREACVVEVWDLLVDVGEALRGLDVKIEALRRQEFARAADVAVSGLWVLRGTQRNRRLVAEHKALFAARFRGSSPCWLEALRTAGAPMPVDTGLVWTDVRRSRLYASRVERVRAEAGVITRL